MRYLEIALARQRVQQQPESRHRPLGDHPPGGRPVADAEVAPVLLALLYVAGILGAVQRQPVRAPLTVLSQQAAQFVLLLPAKGPRVLLLQGL